MPAKNNKEFILIADDDPDDQELMADALSKIDASARTAMVSNGKEAIEFLAGCSENHLPSAIVLDYSMPYLSGVEVLAKLLEQPRFHSIPKFVWSTSRSPQYRDDCIKKGALNYFVKPDSPHVLLEIAREILTAGNR